jgi:hypothetical protein
LDIVKCKACGNIYVTPIFDEEKYKDLYKSEEYNKIIIKHTVASHTYRKNRFGDERIAFINKHHNPKLKNVILILVAQQDLHLNQLKKTDGKLLGSNSHLLRLILQEKEI